MTRSIPPSKDDVDGFLACRWWSSMDVSTLRSVRPIALVLALIIAPVARPADPPVPLHYDLALDASLTGGMGVTMLLLSVFQPKLAPATCHWCVPGGLDASVRNALVWNKDFHAADVLSSVVAEGVLPLSALGYLVLSAGGRGGMSDGLVDALLVAEAVSAQLILCQTVKLVVGRERPYSYYGREVGAAASDKNAAFYGGHSSFAFSIVAATVTVASMRGYSGTREAAGVGFALATGVAYLRIAADQHYLTDVLVGAAIGGLMGWAVPHLFHSRKEGQPGALRLTAGGLAIAF